MDKTKKILNAIIKDIETSEIICEDCKLRVLYGIRNIYPNLI